MKPIAPIALAAMLASPAFAESHISGDAEAGAEVFDRQCVTCHVVVNEEGETLAGKKSKTGPNLYGIVGRTLGSVDGYRYGKGLESANEAGLMWTEENFVPYVQDPKGWLREALDDSKARSKMSYKVREEEDAVNVYAFLASIGPEVMMDEGAEMEETEETEEAPASN